MNHDNAPDFAPPFVRLNYYHGQMLSAQDFRAEQLYFREKRRLLNRMVLGHGIAYGLEVRSGEVVVDDCPANGVDLLEVQTRIARLEHRLAMLLDNHCAAEAEEVRLDLVAARQELPDAEEGDDGEAPEAGEVLEGLVISPGYALDCRGNDIVVRDAVMIDPNVILDREERLALDVEGLMRISICYDEEPILPTRPMGADPCDDPGEVSFARIRETVRVKLAQVAADAIDGDHVEEPCGAGEGCGCACLSLALVPFVRKEDGTVALLGRPDNAARRPLTVYDPTRIVDISWAHGSTYGWDQSRELLRGVNGEGGIEVRFSRPVMLSTLIPGVVDLTLRTGGDGASGDVKDIGCIARLADGGRSLIITQKSRENFNAGDRIILTIRTSHLLDRCGRPVLGANLGGRIPENIKRGGPAPMIPHVRDPEAFDLFYRHFQPWSTGAGGPFVSWINIGEPPAEPGGE